MWVYAGGFSAVRDNEIVPALSFVRAFVSKPTEIQKEWNYEPEKFSNNIVAG